MVLLSKLSLPNSRPWKHSKVSSLNISILWNSLKETEFMSRTSIGVFQRRLSSERKSSNSLNIINATTWDSTEDSATRLKLIPSTNNTSRDWFSETCHQLDSRTYSRTYLNSKNSTLRMSKISTKNASSRFSINSNFIRDSRKSSLTYSSLILKRTKTYW